MKEYYLVTTAQAALIATAIAVMSGASVAAVTAFINYQDLPIVEQDDKRCIKVLNFKNGDGYQCSDVGVLLRKYRTQDAKSS